MDENRNAINYVMRLIEKIDPNTKVKFIPEGRLEYCFRISIQGQSINIVLGQAIMEDFEVALSKHTGTSYYNAIESAVKFQIYISLGQEGLIPNFSISTEILNEKRDWAEGTTVNVSFSEDFCRIMIEGLKKLSKFLEETIDSYKDLNLPDFKRDYERVNSLIKYYKENHSFLSTGVSTKSLGYLKAAAFCEIVDRENRKKLGSLPRITKEIDREIYFIVAALRNPPFLEIGLPECAYEYASHHKSITPKDTLLGPDSKERQVEPGALRKSTPMETGESIAEWSIKEEKFTPPSKVDAERLYECFVIMPMGKEGTEKRRLNDAVFFKIIKPCIENTGFNITCSHAGLMGDTGSIPAQIIEKLYNSHIVVADLRELNPNVMWELGVRHTFLKRSIMICSNTEEIKKFFDASVFRAIPYHIDGKSNQVFFNQISSCVQAIIASPTKSDNPVWDHRPVKYKTPSIFLMKASIDDAKTNYSTEYQGGNHMKISFSIMFENESPEKNYIMDRKFSLLDSKKELIGLLNIAGETPLADSKDDLGYVAKVFEKGTMLPEDSPLLWDFEASIHLDNVKKKISIEEKDELRLSCDFIPRNGSSFSAGTVKFPVIFSR